MRNAARIDANQTPIVSALRRHGALVYIIGKPLDLLVGFRGALLLIEVKDGKKPPSDRKLTPDQVEFMAAGWPATHVVKSVDEALEVLFRVPT
jgi:hypothetical protein